MITDFLYNSDPDRKGIVERVTGTKIDVGGAFPSHWRADAVVDLNEPIYPTHLFRGNINLPYVWEDVLRYIKKNGKFDFSICTHTLEDISNPLYVSHCLEGVSKKGIIIVPSKYRESGRYDFFRGFIHHRWIWNMEGGELFGYPKIPYFEHPKFDALNSKADSCSELVIFWENEIGMKLVNDDFLGPDEPSVKFYYDKLIDNE